MPISSFSTLAARPEPLMDEIALALAAEFHDVDADGALARLDELGEEVAHELLFRDDGLRALTTVLGDRERFAGAGEEYDSPDNSMLDIVLQRRTGLPIVLSVVYVEVARRAGIDLDGVGLPGHYVVGSFASAAPVLLDPFAGGARVAAPPSPELRPWGVHETAARMLNNLVGSYVRRYDLARAIRAAEMRLDLPVDGQLADALGIELRSLRARLN